MYAFVHVGRRACALTRTQKIISNYIKKSLCYINDNLFVLSVYPYIVMLICLYTDIDLKKDNFYLRKLDATSHVAARFSQEINAPMPLPAKIISNYIKKSLCYINDNLFVLSVYPHIAMLMCLHTDIDLKKDNCLFAKIGCNVTRCHMLLYKSFY